MNNYINAMNKVIDEREKFPISSRLIKHTHKILMSNVKGENKMPAEYRTSQNWIGGNSLADAVFIPPHPKYVNDLMGEMENFLHAHNISVPLLIRIGIAHYQLKLFTRF